MKRKKYNLLVVLIFSAILFSSLPILAISSATVQVTPGVQMIPLATSFYSEDFTNDSLEDTLISTAPGWGTGVVTNQRQLSISLLDFYNTSTNIVDVAVQGRKVYATGYSIGASTDTLFCFNITDPSNIEYMSDRDSGVGFLTGTVQGDVHYIGADLVSSGWIGVYNVTNPNTFDQPVTFITGFFPDGPVTDLEVRGHFLFGTVYNSTSSRGLIVYDVEDPYNIQQITNTIAFDDAMGLDVAGQYAYVCDGPNGLYVLNVSFPYGIPNPIGSVNTPGTATDILVDGHLGILADGPEGVFCFRERADEGDISV